MSGIKSIGGRSQSTIDTNIAANSLANTPDLYSGAVAGATADVAVANLALNAA